MDFHTNDNNPIITLSNYEEYFLMYVDNELMPAERGLVEAFVQFHPELQAELDLLMGTKLEPEGLPFGDKESLLAQNIQTAVTDEALLLYVDGELDKATENEVQEKLGKSEAYQQEYQWLLRTKSNPAEVVPYPHKEELYRRTVRRIGLPFALRIAAAVLLLASMGVLYVQQNESATPNAVAAIPKKPTMQNRPDGVDNAAAEALAKKDSNEQVQQAAPEALPTALIAAAAPVRKAQTKQAPVALKTPAAGKAAPVAAETAMAYEPAPVPRKSTPGMQPIEFAKKEFEPAVTYDAPQPYIISDATANASFAVEKEEEGDGRSKGNLKSLLRKATRMVERRTGINATNEDEELLIGVVALKLK